MGDLNSEITELDSINLFYASIEGMADITTHASLRSLNYKEYFYLKFQVSFLENDEEKLKDVTPDCLLWNNQNQIALIFEIKGGNSIEEKDVEQLTKYKEISIEQVQTRLRNLNENPIIELKQIIVGIVYYDSTIRSCERSIKCSERLNSMKRDFLVLKQTQGDCLTVLNPELIIFDSSLRDLLVNGILLPRNPPRNIYLTKEPCLKGTIWAIVNYIHNNFFNGETENNEITVEPFDLRKKLFSYSNVTPKRLKQSLDYLTEFRLCYKNENNYNFQFNDFDNVENIFEKIRNIDCNRPIPMQRDMNNFI